MDPADRATLFAQTMSAALNCLGILLCGPARRTYPLEMRHGLERWEDEFAPFFRGAAPDSDPRRHARLAAAVESLSREIRVGLEGSAPEELAPLRLAVRELMLAVGIPLPEVPAAEAAVCELHGSQCPVLDGSA